MGQRGPKRKPTKLLERSGSWLAKKRANEVKAEGKPRCPKWLDAGAKAYWKVLAKQIDWAAEIDENVLARYCRTLSRWHTLQELLMETGETFEGVGSTGQPFVKARPEVEIINKLEARMDRLEANLGVGPSARAGLVGGLPPKEEEADPFEALKLVGAKDVS